MTASLRPRKPTSPRAAPPSVAPTPAPVSPAAKAGLAWLHSTRFLTTAARLDQLPQGDLPEIAFVGRSNAGKSSAINTLAQQRQLAFASKTPGRTQHINLFALGPREAPDAYLADLPGYGYAAVDRGKKLVWQKVMADYLELRRALSGVVMMVDSRHGFTPLDRQLLDFIAQRVRTGEVRLLVLLTKADKLGKREAQAAVDGAQEVLGDLVTENSDVGVTLFSSLRRIGLEDVAETLKAWMTPADATSIMPEDTGKP
jgi:GTP-binding protein